MNRCFVIVVVSLGLAACGGAKASAPSAPAGGTSLHSPELNRIMKLEVNQPYSALQFMVFHGEGGEIDYAAIAVPAETLRGGITKVRAIVDPPVTSNEARSVFFTFVENLSHDADKLAQAVARRDRAQIEATLGRIGETCNNCHHFFRLAIDDTKEGGP